MTQGKIRQRSPQPGDCCASGDLSASRSAVLHHTDFDLVRVNCHARKVSPQACQQPLAGIVEQLGHVLRIPLAPGLLNSQQDSTVGLLVTGRSVLEPLRQTLTELPLAGGGERCVNIELRLLRPVAIHLVDQFRCRHLLHHTSLQQEADITEVFFCLPALAGFKPVGVDHAGSPFHINGGLHPFALTQADTAQQMPLFNTIPQAGLQGLKA